MNVDIRDEEVGLDGVSTQRKTVKVSYIPTYRQGKRSGRRSGGGPLSWDETGIPW